MPTKLVVWNSSCAFDVMPIKESGFFSALLQGMKRVNCTAPETKNAFITWKQLSSPLAVEFKTILSVRKIMGP
jgi:hypothetical protein